MGTVRHLEVRRHVARSKPSEHLTQKGIRIARAAGETMGPFERVYSSTLGRAYETAVAMGFAVDEQLETLCQWEPGFELEIAEDDTFAGYRRAYDNGGAVRRMAEAQASQWAAIAAGLPEGGAALVIAHGGIVEAGAVGAMPQGEHETWGRTCRFCEGVRISYDGDRAVELVVLRRPKKRRRGR